MLDDTVEDMLRLKFSSDAMRMLFFVYAICLRLTHPELFYPTLMEQVYSHRVGGNIERLIQSRNCDRIRQPRFWVSLYFFFIGNALSFSKKISMISVLGKI